MMVMMTAMRACAWAVAVAVVVVDGEDGVGGAAGRHHYAW